VAELQHVAGDELNQVDRPGDVGVDDVAHVLELLVEEGAAEAVAGVGEQRVDGPALRRGVQLVDAVLRGEVDLDGVDSRARRPAEVGDLGQAGGVRRQQQVESVAGGDDRQLTTDAGRGAGHDGVLRVHETSGIPVSAAT
jgi:hypothetical protein